MSKFKVGDWVVSSEKYIEPHSGIKCVTGEAVKVALISDEGNLGFSGEDGGAYWYADCFEYYKQKSKRDEIISQIEKLQKELEEIDNPKYTVSVTMTKQEAEQMLETWKNPIPLAKWLQPIAKQLIDGVKENMEVLA